MKKIISGLVTTGALVVGFSLTTAAIAYGENYFKDNIAYTMESGEFESVEQKNIKYEKNANGQTFGSSVNAVYSEELPDLVIVVGDNGKTGYVYSEELFGNEPSSPEEANKIQESIENGTYVPKVFNVYKSDGKTIIDTFTETLPN